MAYKSILTLLSDTAVFSPVLDAAVAVARQEDAHLDVICIGVDRTQLGYFYEGATVFMEQGALEQAQRESEELAAHAREVLSRQDIRWSVESQVAQLGSLGTLAALRARFADLVLVPKPYAQWHQQDAEVLLEASIFDARASVLVLPESGVRLPLGRRIVIAWNRSNEALAAIRRARPLLQRADAVSIAVIDPPQHGPERSDPGGALAQMLARHGIKAEIAVLARTQPRISDEIARHAMDFNADLIVMGAYGHSRFREAILGGATRNTLENVEIPVMMAH